MEVFTHKPLDLKRDQIRLLKVEHSASDSIRCSIKAYDQRDCPPYEALSYVWGPEHPVRSIILDERIFEIRENLWQFLRNIQHKSISCYWRRENPYQPEYLWIDQICIDQGSTQERNHQVRHMADIYSNATRVACWLGPSSPDSASGMHALLKLNEIWHKDLESTPESGIQFIRKNNAAARGLLSIFEREYWTRLWVVQEFLIPPDLLLICGTELVTWSQLHDIIGHQIGTQGLRHMTLEINGRDGVQVKSLLGSAKTLLVARKERIHEFPSPIHLKGIMDMGYALIDFSSLACKEPHDKIYALLSLVYERQRLPIQYEQPANVIFWQMMASINLSQYAKNEIFVQLGYVMGVTGKETDSIVDGAQENFKILFGDK